MGEHIPGFGPSATGKPEPTSASIGVKAKTLLAGGLIPPPPPPGGPRGGGPVVRGERAQAPAAERRARRAQGRAEVGVSGI